MRFEIEAATTGGLRIIDTVPNYPLSRLEGYNGVGKTVAIHLLELATGRQPYAHLIAAWRSLKQQLTSATIRVEGLRNGHELRIELLPQSWPDTPTLPNAWDYFANGKLAELTITDGGGAMVEQHAVGYLDPDGIYVNGNRTVDEQVLRGPDSTAPCRSLPGCRQTYEYDPRDRLVAYDDGQPAGTDTSYLLDVVGNIASQTDITGGVAATTTYDYLGNQLQSVTPAGGAEQRYFYDPTGNLACVTLAAGDAGDCPLASGGSASANLLARYTYDYLDRLVSYRSFATNGTTSTIGDVADYEHDALDRVAEQTESHDGGASRLTQFGYLGLTGQVAGETQFAGSSPTPAQELTTKTYSYDVWGHRIAVSDDATDLGAPGAGDPAAKPYTYAYDVHGSVSLLLDEAGTATASYGYRPYGAADDALTAGDFDPSDPDEDTAREDNPLNAFRYTGRRLDTGSGSIDMGARRYGPDTSRFLQRDFLNGALGDLGLAVDPLAQGRYNLAGGNPVSFVEWDGHRVLLDGGGGGVCLQCEEDEPPDITGPLYSSEGVEPVTQSFEIERRPGFGTVEIDFFIMDRVAGLPGLQSFLGDDRSFDSQAPPYESRAVVRFDFEAGEATIQVNPTCTADLSCSDPFPIGDFSSPGDFNRVAVGEGANGSVSVLFGFRNPIETSAPAISGVVTLYPDPASGSFGVVARKDGYPAFESYQYVDGQTIPLLLIGQKTPAALFPPDDETKWYFPP